MKGEQTNTKIYAAQRALLKFMEFGKSYKHKVLLEALGNNGIDQFTVDNAMSKLVQQGKLTRPQRGIYRRKEIVK